MSKQFIISIGREFGSGGHEIAEKLSQKLKISLYDRNMLDEIAKEKNMDVTQLHKLDEKPRNPLFSRRVIGYSNSFAEIVADMQFEYIKNTADKGESFIVVGRCAEAVLSEHENLISIFILGDKAEKIARVMEKYHLNESDAIAKMNRHDKTRKYYHNSHTESKWGDSRTYDLCVNSSRLGIDKTVELLESYIKERI